jgi:methionyl aminopeptidase
MKFSNNGLYKLHNKDWLEKQIIAGKCVASILNKCKSLIEEHTPISIIDFEPIIDQEMKEYNCIPTFFGYRGFPSKMCTSLNNELVHGFMRDIKLKDGDVLKLDLGATYEGAIADSATTCIYGNPISNEHVRMLEVCKNALQVGINAVKIGEHLGVIGDTIFKYVKSSGFGLITDLGGHALWYNQPHAPPFVSNRQEYNDGIRIQPGLAICIEPLICMGSPKITTKSDGWTITTQGINCHEEHSIFVEEDGVKIISSRI